ncbi:PGRS repeat-containing protein [Mycolicibacter senuensis]|uniref:PGRS repeat-containing protein n=1 Tax=Mycolicibacter senuensis TaxID=386913 RepID=UPI000A228D4D|nr:hypothetical protein [Mycolicibacter senuensis]ORW69693.1 hypothetical protein AWC24_04700 [Mycolicibacter senuensis]
MGAAASLGTFLTFGVMPLAPAQADEFGWIADVFDVSAWVPADDGGASDAVNWLAPASWDLDGLPGSAVSPSDASWDDWAEPWIYLLKMIQADFWMVFSHTVNEWFGNGHMLIGDGADGYDGGTVAAAAGEPGGLWWGDGGDGGTSASGVGGAGGAAYFGNGGAGGEGVDGADGGPGGTVAYFGNGGDGGDGGDGGPGGQGGWLYGNDGSPGATG